MRWYTSLNSGLTARPISQLSSTLRRNKMDAKQARRAAHFVNGILHVLSANYHMGLPIGDIDAALVENDFNATEPAIYCGRDGHTHEHIGSGYYLSLSWHKMDVTGRYEVTAYVS
jgi:hypothetical protein